MEIVWPVLTIRLGDLKDLSHKEIKKMHTNIKSKNNKLLWY